MNIREHLLVCFNEELMETSKAISKALRFGLDDINPITKDKNSLAIAKEFIDVISIMELLESNNILVLDDVIDGYDAEQHIIDKKEKVIEYMKYAKSKKILNGNIEKIKLLR